MKRLPVLLAIVLPALAGQPRAQEPLFSPSPTSPVEVGEGSGTILLEDINRDGRLDLLTRHLLTRRIIILRGDGRGGFSPFGPPVEFEYEPGDMRLGDVNRDRIPDLVVTAGRSDIVDVLLGDGQGGFRPVPGSPFTLSRMTDTYNKRTLHLADVNGDGNLDIGTANGRLRNTVRTLLGNGQGGFAPGPVIELDVRGDGFVLAFGDLDGDGGLDIVTASRPDQSSGRLAVQKGEAGGRFSAAAVHPIPASPSAVALADLDNDGRTDIVVGHSTGQVSMLLNRGGAVFEPAAGSPVETGGSLFALLALDVNGDRRADLAIPTVNHVTVLLSVTDGFQMAPGAPYRAGPGAYYLGAGDTNGDGKVDLVASSFEGIGVTVLLGR
jgi:hypothetical protein